MCAVTEYVTKNDTHVNVRFINVPATCIDIPVTLPCAADDPVEVPPLFWCVFVGKTGLHFDGPLHAYAKHDALSGKSLTKLSCSLPDEAKTDEITEKRASLGVNVSIVHGLAPQFLHQLPFVGLHGGNIVMLS